MELDIVGIALTSSTFSGWVWNSIMVVGFGECGTELKRLGFGLESVSDGACGIDVLTWEVVGRVLCLVVGGCRRGIVLGGC